MTYELAKELKDAGFPQEKPLHVFVKNKQGVFKSLDTKYIPAILEKTKIPTLSELIKACGDKIHGIGRYNKGVYTDGWWAFGLLGDLNSFTSEAEGTTPEEAVARLWLALNEST